jgi:hypothetical protein
MLGIGLTTWRRSAAGGAAGAAALLAGETDGFAADFSYGTDAQRVAVKVAGVVTEYTLDGFFSNSGTGPKQVFDSSGALIWSPHNMFLNSAVPVTQSVSLVTGQNYTMTVTGSGSLAGTVGASGTASAGSPATFTATGASGTFTKTGTLTTMQLNRGAVATTYLATTAAIRNGLAVDYDLLTLAPKGLLLEPAATNLLLNNATLSTQSVTVSAVAYTLSFWGTGTITLSGVSTAGPLVGTGVNNRVSLNFTPTAGSLTLTVSGTVSRAQLETGALATSPYPTYAAAGVRSADNYTFLLSTIPAIGAEYSLYAWYSTAAINSSRFAAVLTDGTVNELAGFRSGASVTFNVADGAVTQFSSASVAPAVANVFLKAAMRVKANDFAGSADGAAVLTDATGTLPTVTEIRFGGTGSNGSTITPVNIKHLVIVPRGWSNAELVTRTAA